MRALGRVEVPKEIPVSLTISGTLEEFRALRSQLAEVGKWPSHGLASALYDVITKVENSVDARAEFEP